MERPGDLMTVKDFAMAAGRSQQAIYKQIGTRLASYVHEKEGQKYIERRALAEVFKIGDIQPIQPANPKKNPEQTQLEQQLYATMQATIDLLREQVQIKDQQIEIKDKQIAAQTEQVAQLTAALEHTTTSLQAAQALHAGTMQQMLPETAPEGSVTEVAAEPIQDTPTEVAEDEPSRKWWQFWK